MALTFELQHAAHGRVLVMLEGVLDRHTVPTLHRALAQALQSYPSVIHVDLTAVIHIDAAGSGALQAAARVGDQAGYRLAFLPSTVPGRTSRARP